MEPTSNTARPEDSKSATGLSLPSSNLRPAFHWAGPILTHPTCKRELSSAPQRLGPAGGNATPLTGRSDACAPVGRTWLTRDPVTVARATDGDHRLAWAAPVSVLGSERLPLTSSKVCGLRWGEREQREGLRFFYHKKGTHP